MGKFRPRAGNNITRAKARHTFPGVITITAATFIAIATAITPPIIITTATTAISGTPIKVKVLPFGETLQKVSASTFL